jgi:hypothetical protein
VVAIVLVRSPSVELRMDEFRAVSGWFEQALHGIDLPARVVIDLVNL